MKVVRQTCLKNYTITDSEGASFKIKRGKKYITSNPENSDTENVAVFSRYWVSAPKSIFGHASPL